MKHTYTNRYRDAIEFERIDENTVTMKGGKWMRYGWPNAYDRAYAHYLEKIKELEEPDYDLLAEDLNENRVRPFTIEEFVKVMQGNLYDTEEKKAVPALRECWKHVYSDRSTYDMVDPSGGPYLTTGMDLEKMVGFPESFVIRWIGSSSDEQDERNDIVTFKNIK